MGAVQYHYGDRIVETRKWYLMILPAAESQIFPQARRLKTRQRGYRNSRGVAATPITFFFRQIIHIGNNGLCISISSASCLLSVSWFAAAIAIIMTVSYRQFLNRRPRHRKRRPDARRKAEVPAEAGTSTGRSDFPQPDQDTFSQKEVTGWMITVF